MGRRVWVVVLVAAAVVVALAGVVIVLSLAPPVPTSPPPPPPPPPVPPSVVQAGDLVAVDYIGFFLNGRVFNTSIQEVAEDNAAYPKAVSFQTRTSYTPLRFTVGADPRTVIQGFEHGVLFPTPMRVGEVREVTVPPEMGYGPSDPTKIEVRPLRQELTQFETLLREDFIAQFQETPVAGLTFAHPTWQWDTTVVEVSGDFVTIMHLPEVGFVLQPFGAWEARVLEVDTSANGGQGRIVVLHLLDLGHVDNVEAEDERGTFRIVNVDPIADTYTVDYNSEVVGKTLIFHMELLTIARCPRSIGLCIEREVTRVIDGDTLDVEDGLRIRLVLVDAPELSEPGGPAARDYLTSLCLGSFALIDEDDFQIGDDPFGRILAVVYCGGTNANAALISSGHADTYYDFCSASEFGNEAWTGCSSPPPPPPPPLEEDCDPAYPDVCIPSPPPDLDCGDIPYQNFRVLPPDPHHFDGDGDGIGCES